MEKWKLNAGRQLVIAVLLTFAFAMLPSAVAGDVQGSDEDSIRDVLKKLEVANNSGDAEKWVSLSPRTSSTWRPACRL